jgi:repressor LexA
MAKLKTGKPDPTFALGRPDMSLSTLESLGPKIRGRRRKLGLTLDELSGRTGISKPYLSLIENSRVNNPPSDEKLRRLEQSLGFGAAELVGQAHLERTPQDIRAILMKLSGNGALTSGALPDFRAIAAVPPPFAASIVLLTELVGWPDVVDKDAFAGRVLGDGMAPDYRQGDIVVFSPALRARAGDDCLVRLVDGRMTFHRVFFETDAADAPVVRLQPRNEKHRPTVVSADEVAAIHRAAFKYQPVDSEPENNVQDEPALEEDSVLAI